MTVANQAGALTVGDVTRELGAWFPVDLAENWDNVGLLLGDPARPVRRVMTCLTLTSDVAEEAIADRVDLVVTHHPIFFKAVRRLTADGDNRHLWRLASAGAAVFSPHTAFDNAREGINRQLAERLGLSEIVPLKPNCEADDEGREAHLLGAGRVGRIADAMKPEALAKHVAGALDLPMVQLAGRTEGACQTIGIVCGSGASFLDDAASAGCDSLLLGEARFHDCLAARELGLTLILVGHYESERFALEALARRCQRHWPVIDAFASRREVNPIVTIERGPR